MYRRLHIYIVSLLSLLLTLLPTCAVRATTTTSVLSSGQWKKLSIPTSGIYKLTYEDIVSLGLDPQTVRIFGYGGALKEEVLTADMVDDLPEVPIKVYKGSDNQFGSGDYILFYGVGTISWSYTAKSGESTPMFHHTQNCYSTKGYYFITSGGAQHLVTTQAADTNKSDGDINNFTERLLHEQELVNFIGSGREFYGEEFNAHNKQRNFTLNCPSLQNSPARAYIDIAGRTNTATTMTVDVSGTSIGSIPIAARNAASSYEYAKVNQLRATFTPNGGNQLTFDMTLQSNNAQAWLNYIECNATRALQLQGDQPLAFRVTDYLQQGKHHRYVLKGADNNTEVWNITQPNNVKAIALNQQGSTVAFVGNTSVITEYIAFNPANITAKPTIEGNVPNQNLHGLNNIDMVIITHADFMAQAERLAQLHREHDNINVTVVDAVQVYNEFSSGTPDATAYRLLMKMLYDRNKGTAHAPKLLLLFGDGSYDNRHLLPRISDEPIRRLLTYQSYNSVFETVSYVSDDYFGYLDDGEGKMDPTETIDIGIGRLPVYNIEQAKTAVDKIVRYLNEPTGKWRTQLLFMADDGDNNEHITSADSVARLTHRANPTLTINKLYFDAFHQEVSASGERYPEVEQLFDNYLKQGVLSINYMGHGGYTGWSNEAVLNTDKILKLKNQHLPLFITATCDFSRFDDSKPTAGEQLFRNANGGAIALYTTTRTVYANPNFVLNCHISRDLYTPNEQNDARTLGEVLSAAKNQQRNSSNKFCFTLLGDPALKLLYPHKLHVVTDSINGREINIDNNNDTITDTISALSVIHLCGSIRNADEQLLNNFNGTIFVTVYDKEERVTTLCNDATEEHDNTPFVFYDRSNPIFSGTAEVNNGKFSIDFMVPKDIRYNFGAGRIEYYAFDNDKALDANGYFEQFIVGGEDHDAKHEDNGPAVKMYLNSPLFNNGDKVAQTPLFVAEISDENGINTIGSGIGHDMVLRLDNNHNTDIVLNAYYISNPNTYQSGIVHYELPTLDEGKHTLHFKVWDLQNNSTTDSLTFVIGDDIKPRLKEMMCYPSPAHPGEVVTINYWHDRPLTAIAATLRLYNSMGELIEVTQQYTTTEIDNRHQLQWQLNTDNYPPGIYIIRLTVTDDNESTQHRACKLVIVR